MITSNLEELIVPLRIQLGDITTPPTYTDDLLHVILREAVEALMYRWHDRYYVTVEGVVTRSTLVAFDFSSPPVIQGKDKRPIVLQASVMIKTGAKFTNSGSAVNWRDEEISYSNIESAKQRSSTLNDDIKELESLLPAKRLARPQSGRMPGWNRDWE